MQLPNLYFFTNSTLKHFWKRTISNCFSTTIKHRDMSPEIRLPEPLLLNPNYHEKFAFSLAFLTIVASNHPEPIAHIIQNAHIFPRPEKTENAETKIKTGQLIFSRQAHTSQRLRQRIKVELLFFQGKR